MEQLPLEILSKICEYVPFDERVGIPIPCRSHLKAFRLSCKAFASIAEPLLFTDLNLPYDQASFNRLIALAEHEHLSHYVKKIHYNAYIPDDISSWDHHEDVQDREGRQYMQYFNEMTAIRVDCLDLVAFTLASRRLSQLREVHLTNEDVTDWEVEPNWGATEASMNIVLSALLTSNTRLEEISICEANAKLFSSRSDFPHCLIPLSSPLKRLQMEINQQFYVESKFVESYFTKLLLRASNLEQLTLDFGGDVRGIAILWDKIWQDQHWPHLCELQLYGIATSSLSLQRTFKVHRKTLRRLHMAKVLLIGGSWPKMWQFMKEELEFKMVSFEECVLEGRQSPELDDLEGDDRAYEITRGLVLDGMEGRIAPSPNDAIVGLEPLVNYDSYYSIFDGIELVDPDTEDEQESD